MNAGMSFVRNIMCRFGGCFPREKHDNVKLSLSLSLALHTVPRKDTKSNLKFGRSSLFS